MKNKKKCVTAGIATVGAAFIVATQGIAQAAPTPQVSTLKAPSQIAIAADGEAASRALQTDWNPPAGYVFERAFMGDEASCRMEGDRGVTEGTWRQYVCHGKMVKVADAWVLHQYLYVKK
ncbi:hypothetical protein ADL22_26690 [Streptomyces sp. NRRL F-4489]|uniref:hypothetical protein n=1 Tax=Streptomyces sp. NRRL F-4489 TaxID=1609095 RepID=UPI00074808EC|nr:hypothetical protein [Streptomyces sp. NRRL F-4489]KUL35614.1 hypothetical protein ADL22_26690 [Streptomyces sp. NRRL F-4489]